MLPIAIHGMKGRLGSVIAQKLQGSSQSTLSTLDDAKVVIDVTSPQGSEEILRFCVTKSIPLVIGTTGHTRDQLSLIEEASLKIPILLASNFALGIDCLTGFLEILFRRYSKGFVDIIEKHHHQKKDKPSGTALFLKQQILHYSPESLVTIHSIRHPGEVGEHHLIFSFDDEKIEYRHKALSRESYAKGAIEAAHFVYQKPPKLYQMRHVHETPSIQTIHIKS